MIRLLSRLCIAALLCSFSGVQARESSFAIRDSFRVGDTGVPCTAQYSSRDSRLKSIFDRGYLLVCRDAAGAVGSMLALRAPVDPGRSLFSRAGEVALECGSPKPEKIDGLGTVEAVACKDAQAGLDYRLYRLKLGKTLYVSEGLAGYDVALRLGLATLVADKRVKGAINVAQTLVSDPAAFARVQAGTLDARSARREAYGRNNGGSYAQAAEFFESLAGRDGLEPSQSAEFVANQGLQQANLGNHASAEALFKRAENAAPVRDIVLQRMIRNFRAINALNKSDSDAALKALSARVEPITPAVQDDGIATGVISRPLAEHINRENELLSRIGGLTTGLSAEDRAAILDAQALQLRGVALRQQGSGAEAGVALEKASTALKQVRGGRITSVSWLGAEILTQRAQISEAAGDRAGAEKLFSESIGLLEAAYPLTPSVLAAKARRAGLLTRMGRSEEALTLFGEVVQSSETVADSSAALRGLMQPYFTLLSGRDDTASAAALFNASQNLQRPGVAQTQAVLARELSEGSGEAGALFRLSLARSRDIVRTAAEVGALAAQTVSDDVAKSRLIAAKAELKALESEQTALQSKLSVFPQYRAAAPSNIPLADLQASLKPNEGYYKLTLIDNRAFAQLVTARGVRSFVIDKSADALDTAVRMLRDSIVRIENGATVTDAFDVQTARSLYKSLFGPVDADMAAIDHLIFEPDGPLLQLPPYVLVTEDDGMIAYLKRISKPGSDPFDMTGIKWLGRGRSVSIAVSPRAFVDVRLITPSRAARSYLGLGHNAKPVALPTGVVTGDCDWPFEIWQHPIASDELELANSIIGGGSGMVLTDSNFTDANLLARADLKDFRILHFATHGLVTSPRPECPARPALVTSFASAGSDGLLSFKEIFDLKLDADIVLLSACDTAGMATASASREAGIATGGNYALDGLVRAFVSAGARSVLASHWPVPDDFDATNRLIGGLFRASPGTSLSTALRKSQETLMDDPETSHPFYWAAFVLLGDGAKPLVPSIQ